MIVLKRSSINLYEITIFILTITVVCFYDIKPLFSGIQVIAILETIYLLIRKRRLDTYITSFLLWFLLFFIFSIISCAWASDTNTTVISVSLSILQVGLLGLCYICYMEDFGRFGVFIKMVIAAGIILCLRFFIVVPFRSWGQMTRFTRNTIFGSNIPSLTLAFFSLICFWYFYYKLQKNLIKSLILPLIFMFISILIGSRKGILFFAVGISILAILNSKNLLSTIGKIVLLAIILVAVYYALMNIPILYRSIGYRFSTLQEGLRGVGGDRSFEDRIRFIHDAASIFKQHPIAGIGQDGYRYQNSLWLTYSHCNYTEILANLGIVGFVLYYLYIIGLLKKTFVIRKTCPLALTLVILVLFMDWLYVSFSVEISYIIIATIVSLLRISTINRKDTQYEQQ